MRINRPPAAVLTVAGLDPSSGAGFTADLKVFAAHGFYGLACPTALTVQSTQGVRRSEPVDPTLIADTLACLADDIPIAGVKIGMLGSAGAVEVVAAWLADYRQRTPDLPVVLDPVLRSSSGHPLLPVGAIPLLKERLLPFISVLTPNLPEAALLTGLPVQTPEQVEAAARAIQPLVQGGRGAVVLTGGHSAGPDEIRDLLATPGDALAWLTGPRVQTAATHGTGCAFSSALLASLVGRFPLPTAVRAAKLYVQHALEYAYAIGRGTGPMHHLFAFDPKNSSPDSVAGAIEPSI